MNHPSTRLFLSLILVLGSANAGTSNTGTPDDVFVRATGTDKSVAPDTEGIAPIWSDEFPGTALNSDHWNYDTGNGVNGWGNGELQNYTSSTDNVYVENGLLHIAVRELADGSYTSGRLNTGGKVEVQYGVVKANISWPDVVEGLWPAFWTLGNTFPSTPWPACGTYTHASLARSNTALYF